MKLNNLRPEDNKLLLSEKISRPEENSTFESPFIAEHPQSESLGLLEVPL